MAAKTCARCGRKLNDHATRVYSRTTGNHYCANVSTCAKRALRKLAQHRKQVAA